MWALGGEAPNGHDFFNLKIKEIEQVIFIPDTARAKK